MGSAVGPGVIGGKVGLGLDTEGRNNLTGAGVGSGVAGAGVIRAGVSSFPPELGGGHCTQKSIPISTVLLSCGSDGYGHPLLTNIDFVSTVL